MCHDGIAGQGDERSTGVCRLDGMPWHIAGNTRRDLPRAGDPERRSERMSAAARARRSGRETRQEAKSGGLLGWGGSVGGEREQAGTGRL